MPLSLKNLLLKRITKLVCQFKIRQRSKTAHFFEDETKFKIHFEIQPPLQQKCNSSIKLQNIWKKNRQIVFFNMQTMRSILIAKLNSAQLLENSAHNITKNYVCTVCHNYNWCILDSTQDLNSRLGVQIQLHFGRWSKLGFN